MNEKLCVDCKHHQEIEWSFKPLYSDPIVNVGHICHAPLPSKVDLVTGEPVLSDTRACKAMREIEGPCGPDGDLFQPASMKVAVLRIIDRLAEYEAPTRRREALEAWAIAKYGPDALSMKVLDLIEAEKKS